MKRDGSLYVHGCGAGMAFLCGVLSVYSYCIDPTGERGQIITLLAILGAMSVYYAVVIWLLVSRRIQAGFKILLLWAAVFRLILLPSQPILETDYYRYLWDGYVLSQGANPYQFAPAEIFHADPLSGQSDSERKDLENLRRLALSRSLAQEILANVNNPAVVTIYPPFAQILFGISSVFFPLSVFGWRVVILFFDATLIFVLIILLPRFGRDPRWVVVYAWSPLVLKEIINTLHFDGIASAGVFLGILFVLSRYPKRSVLSWACATGTKIYPLLLVPLWVNKKEWKTWGLLGMILSGFLFLFSGSGVHGIRGWATFAQRWESNSSLVVVVEWLLGGIGVPSWGEGNILFTLVGIPFSCDAFLIAKGVGVLFVIALAGFWSWKLGWNESSDESRLYGTFILIGAILVWSPVCNPWYITWIVPFLCFYPRLSWLYLSIAVFVHYTFFIPDPWGYLPYSREIEYLPFFMLVLLEWTTGRGVFRSTLSVRN